MDKFEEMDIDELIDRDLEAMSNLGLLDVEPCLEFEDFLEYIEKAEKFYEKYGALDDEHEYDY